MSDNVINKINIGGSTYDIIGVPDGGTTGQVLTKSGETDYDVSWEDVEGGSDVSVTYSELKTLRDNSNLTPGVRYRITDYVCTTTQPETQAASNLFDIIVTADSSTILNENARACHHAGDTYFQNCDLEAWELKYCLDNDTDRFAWADTTNGKGVIYYMKDEWNNECPYDFKNIKFKRYAITNTTLQPYSELVNSNDQKYYYGAYDGWGDSWNDVITIDDNTYDYFYTFALYVVYDNNRSEFVDTTVATSSILPNDEGFNLACYNNYISPVSTYGGRSGGEQHTFCLNNNVFYDYYDYLSTNHKQTFDFCQHNTIIGGSCNTFNYLTQSKLNDPYFITSLYECYCINTTGSDHIVIGSWNSNHNIKDSSEININTDCRGIDLDNSYGIRTGSSVDGLVIYKTQYVDVGNFFKNVTVKNSGYLNIIGGSNYNYLQNVRIVGLHGTSSDNYTIINAFTLNANYVQIGGYDSSGNARIWIEGDTVTGPTTATDNHIALFDGTSGKIIKDSGIAISDLSPDLCTSTTYSALKTLRDGGNLVPGMQYRITDYTCTTTQTNTSSAGHIFDIIVTADDTSTLNENARAAHHSGDTYYQNCNLEAWELKYTIDNDTDRFGWANSTNGKGIVYWMKDENRNEACYDFTNILFNNKYTFNNSGADARLNSTANIHDNIIGPHYDGYASSGSQQQYYTIAPNNIVLEGLMNYDNTFGEECYDLTFSNMTIGNEFDGFTWDCSFGTQTLYNKFGSYCTGNVFPNKFATSTVESHCWYMNVTSTTNYTRCHILGGIQGTSTSNRLNVPITETHQYAGLNSSGVLKTWIPADLIQ